MTTAKYPLELVSNSWLPCGYFQAFCFILELGEKVWLWHFLLSGREFSPCSPLPQGRANCTFRVPSSVLLLTSAPLPSHRDVPGRVEDTEQQGTSLEIPVGGDCDGTSALLVSIWPSLRTFWGDLWNKWDSVGCRVFGSVAVALPPFPTLPDSILSLQLHQCFQTRN